MNIYLSFIQLTLILNSPIDKKMFFFNMNSNNLENINEDNMSNPQIFMKSIKLNDNNSVNIMPNNSIFQDQTNTKVDVDITPILSIIDTGTSQIEQETENTIISFSELLEDIILSSDTELEEIINQSNIQFISDLSELFRDTSKNIVDLLKEISDDEYNRIYIITNRLRKELIIFIRTLIGYMGTVIQEINNLGIVGDIVHEENMKVYDQIKELLQYGILSIPKKNRYRNNEITDKEYSTIRKNILQRTLKNQLEETVQFKIHSTKNSSNVVVMPDPSEVAEKISNALKKEMLEDIYKLFEEFIEKTFNELDRIIEIELQETEIEMNKGSTIIVNYLKSTLKKLTVTAERLVQSKNARDIQSITYHILIKNKNTLETIDKQLTKINFDLETEVKNTTKWEINDIEAKIREYNWKVVEEVIPKNLEVIFNESI